MLQPKSLIVTIIIAALLGFMVPGCSSPTPEQKPGPAANQKEKAPSALENIRKDLDRLIAAVDKKMKMSAMSSLEQNTEIAPSKEAKEEAKSSSSTGKTEQDSKQKPVDWETEETSLRKIHHNWNSLEPEAIRAGLTTLARDNFEAALDNLTREVSEKKIDATLLAAINLYQYYADIAQVFKASTPPDFYRVKYEAMSAITHAGKEEWELAQEHASRTREHWNNLKMQAENIDTKLMNRSEYSVQDLEEAVLREQADLVLIKGEIVMNNLQKLEEEFSGRPPG